MSALALHHESKRHAIALPEPRVAISIRPAVQSDLAFIDGLQKKHTKMVGWFPTKQFETNIEQGHVLIAEEQRFTGETPVPLTPVPLTPVPLTPVPLTPVPLPSTPLGYCIGRDKYMKREDCGIVYQLNVEPGKHRKLVGASLVQATFERAAYGCKLFSCWCAQDIAANHFWESIGFVPLAFRTGSRGRGKNAEPRIHIFWQKRIRAGDVETPYWFPSETSGGAVRENRIILPIPPGTHWSDAKPAVLPGMEKVGQRLLEDSEPRKRTPRRKKKPAAPAAVRGGLWFGAAPEERDHGRDARATDARATDARATDARATDARATDARATKKAKRKAKKNDPKLVAAARELCARYLEEVQSGRMLPAGDGKYDVSRQLEAAPTSFDAKVVEERATPLLDAA